MDGIAYVRCIQIEFTKQDKERISHALYGTKYLEKCNEITIVQCVTESLLLEVNFINK